MSIPKVIHYCWFGKNPLPDKVKEMILTWRKMCPTYEIIQWNESNYDYTKNQYMANAYQEKKWAFVADYARLDIIYHYGGFYLDTDVELVKPLDSLLDLHAFMALERQNANINTGLGFGAEKHNIHIKKLLELYETLSFYKPNGELNLTPCTKYTTDYFQSACGFAVENRNQQMDDIQMLSWEYFCPIDYKTGKMDVTECTIGIHWYDASWFPKHDKIIHEKEKKIRCTFPKPIAKVVCFVYRNGYRLVQYTTDGVLLEKVKRKILEKR